MYKASKNPASILTTTMWSIILTRFVQINKLGNTLLQYQYPQVTEHNRMLTIVNYFVYQLVVPVHIIVNMNTTQWNDA